MSQFTSSQQTLEEARRVQDKTKQRLQNTRRMLEETQEVADETAQRLAEQTEQIGDVIDTVDGSIATLQQVDKNLDSFDHWRGVVGGKRRAEQHALAVGDDGRADREGIKEVLENEKWATLKRTWVASSDPPVFSTVTGEELPEFMKTSLPPRDIRSPTHETPMGVWEVDFDRPNIDAEGWSYAGDFAHFMERERTKSSADWRTSVRQRSWFFTRNTDMAHSSEVQEIKERQRERTQQSSSSSSSSSKGVTVDMHSVFGSGGGFTLTETGGKGDWRSAINQDSEQGRHLTQEERDGLRDISRADREIDEDIDAIGNIVDRLGVQAQRFNEEVTHQNQMLETMERKVEVEQDKLEGVTKRVKWHLFRNK